VFKPSVESHTLYHLHRTQEMLRSDTVSSTLNSVLLISPVGGSGNEYC
jgi:hypothetical protein